MALPAMADGLQRRLRVLQQTGDCCSDLAATHAEAANASGRNRLLATYQALGDDRRLTIASMLKRSPGLCGCELQAALGIGHATVSHHMRALREAGLITEEQRGKWVHYSLTEAAGALVP